MSREFAFLDSYQPYRVDVYSTAESKYTKPGISRFPFSLSEAAKKRVEKFDALTEIW